MKKILILSCICLMIFTLCACGKDAGSNTSMSEENVAGVEAIYTIEDPQMIKEFSEPLTVTEIAGASVLSPGTSFDIGDLRFTFTGVSEFTDQYSPDGITFYDSANAEYYSFILVHYTVENIGTSSINPSIITMTIISDENREHSPNRTWVYDAECMNLDTLETGSWVATSPKLEPEDGVRECLTVFELPDSIAESDVPLQLIIKINDRIFTYIIRL